MSVLEALKLLEYMENISKILLAENNAESMKRRIDSLRIGYIKPHYSYEYNMRVKEIYMDYINIVHRLAKMNTYH